MVRPTIPVFWMALAISTGSGVATSFAEDAQSPKIAVAHFDFVDTSGEIQDQKTQHEKQLRQFEAELQQRLIQGGLVAVALPCGPGRCTLRDPGIDRLKAKAKIANARYLLAGGVHKMSTLIGWAKLIVFDLENSGRVCDRLFTYRGDTEEAWRRAAEFGAKNVVKACF